MLSLYTVLGMSRADVAHDSKLFMTLKRDHLDVSVDTVCLTSLRLFIAQSETGLGLHAQLC